MNIYIDRIQSFWNALERVRGTTSGIMFPTTFRSLLFQLHFRKRLLNGKARFHENGVDSHSLVYTPRTKRFFGTFKRKSKALHQITTWTRNLFVQYFCLFVKPINQSRQELLNNPFYLSTFCGLKETYPETNFSRSILNSFLNIGSKALNSLEQAIQFRANNCSKAANN